MVDKQLYTVQGQVDKNLHGWQTTLHGPRSSGLGPWLIMQDIKDSASTELARVFEV